MSAGWAGPTWGEPSTANQAPVPLRPSGWAGEAAYRAEGGISDDFLLLAASVAGVSHRLTRKRGEDSFGWVHPAPGRLAIVVADGVSTAGRGGEGADLAVRAACRYLSGLSGPWGEMECVTAIAAASEAVTSAGGGAAGELSTTIVVALLEVDADDGSARATAARAGDSTAFTLSPGGAWRELFRAEEEEELFVTRNGQSSTAESLKAPMPAVLPLPPGAGDLGVERASAELPQGTALVLLTDGVADPLRDGPNTVAPALAGAVLASGRGELSPLALAHAADFSRRGAHDDRTVILAWPQAGR